MKVIAAQLMTARTALAPVAGANAALEARLLAAHAWGMSAEQLVLCGNEVRDEAAFAALVARRMQAEPVAQILGTRDFWKDTFIVSRDVLTPRADSETMIETLLCLRPDAAASLQMLDLGTGSGCLVLSALREYRNASAVAADRSDAALQIAAQNAAALEVEGRVTFVRSDWCSNVSGTFDVVLSNPPYIPTAQIAELDKDVRGYEPHGALDGGADGLDCYRAIVQQLPGKLNPKALVLFEVGVGQADDVAVIGQNAGWTYLETVCDLAGISRVVVFEIND